MQNYQNHRRIYPFHHLFLVPITVTIFIWSLVNLFSSQGDVVNQIYNVLAGFTLVLISFIARIYALKNQDRIIRLEMRLRYFEMTGKSFSDKEKQLKQGQIIALRFAGDNEILTLIDRAISEKLSSKEIKLAITDWQADEKRV
ncbi:MAG: DUF6526 family protein [Flavobacteriia bacterium]|jgi:hypothetical protein